VWVVACRRWLRDDAGGQGFVPHPCPWHRAAAALANDLRPQHTSDITL
jgi:hypothetical protein